MRSDVRGRYQLGPLSIRLTDPFGMCELTRSFTASDTLVVTPPVHAAARTCALVRRVDRQRREPGPVAWPTRGEDDAATREYRQGDDLRRVHWRSTAGSAS